MAKTIFLVSILLLSFTPDAFTQSLRKKIDVEEIIICSHRAAMSPDIPENSLYSMQRSKAAGIDMHEIDLAESKDGILYLLHDKTLERTTEGSGFLTEKNSMELDKIKLRGLEENLQRFEHVLEFAKENEIFLMLDVKEASLKKVISLVESFGMLEQIMVLTFNEERAMEALELPQQFLLSVLVTKEEDLDFYLCKTDEPYYLIAYINQNASPTLYQKTTEMGLPIVTDAMGTPDQDALRDGVKVYQEFIKLRKPSVLVTDYPISLRAALED